MIKYDLLIKNGTVVDTANSREGRYDIAVANGIVGNVEPGLNPDQAREVFDASGMIVFPGLVDTHVHLTPYTRAVGFRMLAKAGVTCCLECGGFVEDILKGMSDYGTGISVAVLNRLEPGVSIGSPDADQIELDAYLNQSLDSGALGLKLIGGHFPLSPETTSSAIELANRAGAYVAFHCGTTQNGSNLNGMLEALELAGSNHLHVCHITAYCRGLTHGSPVKETMMALDALSASPRIVSESHNGPYNGTPASLENGIPKSHVTQTCLKSAGYEVSPEGMVRAANDGYMKVQENTPQEVRYLPSAEGASYLKAMNHKVTVSFPVNRRSTAFLTATEKDKEGHFIVTAISTDGGGIPRNFLLSHGLSLVRFDALTLSEFVHKCCWAPARMLGLNGKGHLGPGADGDIVVVNPDTHQAILTVAGGKIIMRHGKVVGTGGTVVTMERGVNTLAGKGVPTRVANLENSLFYKTRSETMASQV